MNMIYGPGGANVYGFEALVEWANRKYDADFSVEQIQNLKPQLLHRQLLELSESFNDGKLAEQVDTKISQLNTHQLVDWANERFGASLTEDSIAQEQQAKEELTEIARE